MKKRADGRYRRSITINGKKKDFYGATKQEVNKKILQYTNVQENGELFKNVADLWAKEHLQGLAHNSKHGYECACDEAKQYFGDMCISTITGTQCKAFIENYASRGYAQKTVATKLMVLNLIFNYAVIHSYIDYSPSTALKVPKNLNKTKRTVPTQEEIEIIKNSHNLLALTALYTGCRRGELMALSIQDFDFENDKITIDKSVYYVHNKPFLKPPKTLSGDRVVPLLKPLKDELLTRNIKGYLFNKNENLLEDKQSRTLWVKFCEENDVHCTLHQLRHAYATRLFELEIDDKSAQEILGHSDITTTRNIYTHIREDKMKMNTKKLEQF